MSVPTALNHDVLAEVITRCAGARTEAATLRAGQPTFTELGVDSLGLLGIVAELELAFGIQLGAEAETCTSPGQLLDIANAKLGSGARG
jgi:minimal PKS acyl carrier protein